MLHKHPYILASLIATLLALVVWILVPKEYTAATKLSDEYKEVDLAIGLDKIQARLNLLNANKGMHDMGVYSKIIETEDFARSISHKQVLGKSMDYGHWVMLQRHFWQTKDTIEAIQDCINYNYSNRHETLTISFSDRDATVAALMLDSVTTELQNKINTKIHILTEIALRNARKEQKNAEKQYKRSLEAYSSFLDSHSQSSIQTEQQQLSFLEKEVNQDQKNYENATKKYIRQRALMQRSAISFVVVKANTVPRQYNSSFWGLWGVFIFICLVFTFWIRKAKEHYGSWNLGDVFSPWSITLIIWTVIICLIQLSDVMEPLSEQFWISFCLWIPIFCVSSFLTYNLTKEEKISGFDSMQINISWYYFFFILAMVLTPMYLYKTYTIVSMFDTKDMMLTIRRWALYGDNYGFLNYSQPILQTTFIISLWKINTDGIKWWHVLLLGVAYLLFSLGKMEKMGMFFAFIYTIYVLFEKGKIKVRSIILLSIVLLIVFYFFNLSRQGEDSNYAKEETLFDFVGMYVMSGAVAYGRLRQNISDIFGAETLNTFYSYFYRWVLGEEYNIEGVGFREFVYVPVATNVYTIFCPFFCDYGQKGVAFFSLVMGTLSGWLYALSQKEYLLFKCLYTLIVGALVMQFFDEVFIVEIMSYIHVIIVLVLMTQRLIIIKR